MYKYLMIRWTDRWSVTWNYKFEENSKMLSDIFRNNSKKVHTLLWQYDKINIANFYFNCRKVQKEDRLPKEAEYREYKVWKVFT